MPPFEPIVVVLKDSNFVILPFPKPCALAWMDEVPW